MARKSVGDDLVMSAVPSDTEDELEPLAQEISADELAGYEKKMHAVQPSTASKLVSLV